ncbi:MAG: hypothetical protein DRI73_10265, partial [Bacteroidetes bacterium]
IYIGAFPDFGGREDLVSTSRIVNFEELAGRKIAWAYFSNNWFDGIKFPGKAVSDIHNKNMVPFIRLMPRSDDENYHKEKIYTMQNIIDGNFDDSLREWARDSKNANIPILVDFALEMNGDWFSWSGYYNGGKISDQYGDPDLFDGPERYRDAYRHIIDIFREEKVNNVTWFFHPDIYSEPDKEWNKAKYYYPGDNYIDWIGVSIYGPQNPEEDYWETFSEILKNRYITIKEITENKPVALLEFGVTDNHPLGKKSEWLDDAFSTILENSYIDFKAISYWHENWEEEDNLFATLRIDSSEESLNTFRLWSNNDRFVSETIFTNSDVSTNKSAELLFKSGFENGVILNEPVADDGGIWWQQIEGSDIGKFPWPMDILGFKGELQLIVDSSENIDRYIVNRIETVDGADGTPTKALHQIIKKKQYEYTQTPYIIYTDGNEIEDLYIKFSLKFPENISELLGEDGWVVISEFKTTGDYRLALYVYQDKSNDLYWYVHGDNVVVDDAPYKEFWYRENRSIPVPVGEWFDMEIYWHRSSQDNGRVWWGIDSETIADYSGQTKLVDPINAVMVFTNYASGPFHQWIDNIEIWSSLP